MSGRVNHPGQFSARTTSLFWSVFNERQHFNVSFLLHKPEPGELWSCFRGVWLKLDDEEKRNALWRTYSTRYLEQTKKPPIKKSRGNNSDEGTAKRELAQVNHPAPLITPELLKQLGL